MMSFLKLVIRMIYHFVKVVRIQKVSRYKMFYVWCKVGTIVKTNKVR